MKKQFKYGQDPYFDGLLVRLAELHLKLMNDKSNKELEDQYNDIEEQVREYEKENGYV